NGTVDNIAIIDNRAGWSVISTGDINHDGTPDIIHEHTTGVVEAFLMRDGAVGATLSLPSLAGQTVVANGAFHPGEQDLIFRQDSDGLVTDWTFGIHARNFEVFGDIIPT
ncbi:MAG: hypothetical protein ACJ8DT_06045, partial [Microvirga sp.]